MDPIKLQSEPRTVFGKKVKSLRRSGTTPIHLYGPGGPPLALQASDSELRNVVVRAGRTSPVSITVDGDSKLTLSLVREVAVHPVSGQIQHVDFLRVDESIPIEVPVNIRLVGESPATVGGQAEVTQVLRALQVSALPFIAPAEINADVSTLEWIGAVLRVRDLELPDGVEAAGHPEDVIARVQKQREAEVLEDQIEEIEEGVEAEGEAATEDAGRAGQAGGEAPDARAQSAASGEKRG